jgi:uncharacterized membrane-anchored protein YitT (DUF2179 family)
VKITRSSVSSFLLINLGLFLTALGIVLFKVPNHFVNGGVSGLSIEATKLFPGLSVGPAMTLINLALVVWGFLALGKQFGWNTVYSSFALSAMVWVLDLVFPLSAPLTHDPMLELFFGIGLPAIGSAIVFNQNSSTGGTDIVAKVLSTKTAINTGMALLVSDFIIAFSALWVFGVTAGLYSVLGLVLKAFLVDLVLENLNVHKQLEIITAHPEPILDFILHTLHRGATIYPAKGAYTGTDWQVIHTVVGRRQALAIRRVLKEHDPKAFVTITTTTEIIGKGFRG